MENGMKLKKLLEKLDYTCLQGNIEEDIADITYNSKGNNMTDTAFVCIVGKVVDGHNFVNDVIEKGVKAVIADREIQAPSHITVIKVSDTRIALAFMSAAYFDYPASSLKTIGITGTKGKTTTTYMVHSILEKAGISTGLIGTIEIITPKDVITASHTTPESYELQKYFRKMADEGCKCVVMEVSSQGLMLNRVAGFTFDIGIFTNLQPDHIGPNEHSDFDNYKYCKGLLFKNCKTGIVNIDDEHVWDVLEGHTCSIETFGVDKDADLKAEEINLHKSYGTLGVEYKLKGKNQYKDMNFDVKIHIPGMFSVYNSLTAIAICNHFGIPEEIIKDALLDVQVKGRVESIKISDKFSLMIDYAHNAMSLDSLLSTLKEYNPTRLVCLFGCGGNRSKYRRFEMGEISSKLADLTVVTSDNPRDEEPQAILDDIIVGVKKADGDYVAIIDRKEAIKYCIKYAEEGDLIVLAGKGHEDYQEIKGVKYHMDERELIQSAIKELEEEGCSII